MTLRLLAFALLCAVTVTSPDAVAQGAGDALGWYEREAKAGDPKAQFYYGVALEKGAERAVDLDAAREWFRRAADAGFALAQYKMGLINQFGETGATADPAAARDWYASAAGNGLAEAAYNLAVMLETGQGGTADAPAAAAWFERAAREGIDEALLRLGVLHARGGNGPDGLLRADGVEALKWFLIAREAGIGQAEALVKTVSDQLPAEARADAEERARSWRSE